MDDFSASHEQQPDVGGLRDRFPGYFPPDDDQVRDFITRGLVAFDTNALLDVYRLNDRAREEYLAALRKLGDRLWIPNRVGQELLDRRLTVIKECSSATDGLAHDLGRTFDKVTELLRAFGNRRGLSKEQVAELEELATQARDTIAKRASDFYTFSLDLDKALKGDAILSELETVLNDKIGPALPDLKVAEAEGKRRIDDEVPPGYADAKKDPERAIGDYLIWRQILIEAARRKLSVVLVSNDQKADWVREDLGKKLGARPELVAEMLSESGMPFHLINVQTFLVHAKKYLGAAVSDGTIAQARFAYRSESEDRVTVNLHSGNEEIPVLLISGPIGSEKTGVLAQIAEELIRRSNDREESSDTGSNSSNTGRPDRLDDPPEHGED